LTLSKEKMPVKKPLPKKWEKEPKKSSYPAKMATPMKTSSQAFSFGSSPSVNDFLDEEEDEEEESGSSGIAFPKTFVANGSSWWTTYP
jgi:hypothetical protein